VIYHSARQDAFWNIIRSETWRFKIRVSTKYTFLHVLEWRCEKNYIFILVFFCYINFLHKGYLYYSIWGHLNTPLKNAVITAMQENLNCGRQRVNVRSSYGAYIEFKNSISNTIFIINGTNFVFIGKERSVTHYNVRFENI
jgi:hypothetical protein